jgi:D-inositol-3-phosphate glycosyltransferase
VPVVGTDVGGVRSAVLDGRTGFLAARDDDQALADGAARLLDDPALGRRFGAAGREHAVSTFGVQRLLADLDTLYRQLCDE